MEFFMVDMYFKSLDLLGLWLDSTNRLRQG